MKAYFPPIGSDKKLGILAFFTAFCLSPGTVSYLFTADGQLNAMSVRMTLWLLSLGMVLFGLAVFFTRLKLASNLRLVLQFIFFGFIPFYASVLIDRATGKFLLPASQHLVFTPNASALYQNPEFTVITRINNLGFRDYEYPIHKKNKYRILVLGSSFTFGWGVALPDTWVKQLERKLQQKNPQVEVLNLGRIGSSPQAYWQIAEKAIPALQPDLVLVSLLQATELLAVTMEEPTARQPGNSFRHYLEIFRANTYPNLLRLFNQTGREVPIKNIWKTQADYIGQHLTRTQRVRFEQLSPVVQNRFLQGNLNPNLVYSFLVHPDLYLQLEHLKPPVLAQGVGLISRYLERIKHLASRNGASTLLFQIPNKFYLCKKVMREHVDLGARIDTSLLHRNTPDSLMKVIAGKTGLPLLQVSPQFKNYCHTHPLYYTYDSHMTPLGHALYASEAFEKLEGYVPGTIKRQ
jgi:hypothetical protein